jgi:hypothetical protein
VNVRRGIADAMGEPMTPLFTVRAFVLLLFATVVGLGVTALNYSSHKNLAKALLAGTAAAGATLLGANALIELH